MSGPTAETIGMALARRYRRSIAAYRRLAAARDPAEPVVVLAHPAAVAEGRDTAIAEAGARFLEADRELARWLWETAEPVEDGPYLFAIDGWGFVKVGRVG